MTGESGPGFEQSAPQLAEAFFDERLFATRRAKIENSVSYATHEHCSPALSSPGPLCAYSVRRTDSPYDHSGKHRMTAW
jgi:hypothetical protein